MPFCAFFKNLSRDACVKVVGERPPFDVGWERSTRLLALLALHAVVGV